MSTTNTTTWRPIRDWRVWALSIGFWFGLQFLLEASQIAVLSASRGGGVEFDTSFLSGIFALYLPLVAATVVLLQVAPRIAAWSGVRFWLRCALVVAGCAALHALVWALWQHFTLPAEARPADAPGGFLWDTVAGTGFRVFHYGALLGGVLAINQRREAEARRRELLAAQLRVLRAQLQPHFLFNTLHAIGATAPRDGATAARMTALLGDLLRQTLRERDDGIVSLAEEQELLQPYLALQALRFADRLKVEVDVAPEVLDAAVPDLLLQPLVENALQHGIEQRPGPGSVRIWARREGELLAIDVQDDGVGVGASAATNGTRTGLASTQARLAALFGERATLTLWPNARGGTTASLRLPYRAVRSAA
ncbi:MAG: histidine kinase [Planctomycetes bacterium]|nr:histidine kinase [Planctomycetota bacterium]